MPSRDAQAVQKQMQQLRDELAIDIRDVVRGAHEMADWRRQVKNYPWASLAAAAALGYLLVPRRVHVVRPDAETLAKLIQKDHLSIEAERDGRSRRGLGQAVLSAAASAITRAAVRAATAYAEEQAHRFVRSAETPHPAGESVHHDVGQAPPG